MSIRTSGRLSTANVSHVRPCGHTQGAHGLWELSVNKAYHADLVEDLLEALVAQLACPDLQVSSHLHFTMLCRHDADSRPSV